MSHVTIRLHHRSTDSTSGALCLQRNNAGVRRPLLPVCYRSREKCDAYQASGQAGSGTEDVVDLCGTLSREVFVGVVVWRL